MRPPALFVAALLLLSGCMESSTPSEPSVEADGGDGLPVGSERPDAVPPSSLPPPVEANNSMDPLANRTTVGFVFSDDLGPTAFEVAVDVGRSNRCEFRAYVSGFMEGAGVRDLVLHDNAQGTWPGWGSRTEPAYAHADGVADTRGLSAAGEFWSASWRYGTFDGVQRVTVLSSSDVRPVELDGGDPSASLRVEVECLSPFDVLGGRSGNEVQVLDGHSLSGLGAGSNRAGSATVASRNVQEVAAPWGRVVAGVADTSVARVILSSPEEQESLLAPLDGGPRSLEGGPGSYVVDVDAVEGPLAGFWCAMYGLAADVDLRAHLYDEPVMERHL